MTRNTIYLEASARTGELLNAQRALRAAEYAIGSTWHDQVLASTSSDAGVDWLTERCEELDRCDTLIVLCGARDRTRLQVPLLAGYALARGMKVIWIGSSVRVAVNDGNVAQFDTVEEFCNTLTVRLAA